MKCTASDECQMPAEFAAAQSTDQGQTIDWQLICEDHAHTWNDGSDWEAPVYWIVLGAQLDHDETISEGREASSTTESDPQQAINRIYRDCDALNSEEIRAILAPHASDTRDGRADP